MVGRRKWPVEKTRAIPVFEMEMLFRREESRKRMDESPSVEAQETTPTATNHGTDPAAVSLLLALLLLLLLLLRLLFLPPSLRSWPRLTSRQLTNLFTDSTDSSRAERRRRPNMGRVGRSTGLFYLGRPRPTLDASLMRRTCCVHKPLID